MRSSGGPPPGPQAHLSLRLLGLVAVGGTIGTAARAGVSLALPSTDSIPWATVAVNLLGAFLLGLLLESLARRGPDTGARRASRLLLGTGVLGGFTTYSALATDTALFGMRGEVVLGAAYSLGSVVFGLAATVAGIAVAARITRRRHPEAQGGLE